MKTSTKYFGLAVEP